MSLEDKEMSLEDKLETYYAMGKYSCDVCKFWDICYSFHQPCQDDNHHDLSWVDEKILDKELLEVKE